MNCKDIVWDFIGANIIWLTLLHDHLETRDLLNPKLEQNVIREKKRKKVMVVTLDSLSLLHINYCLQQKQQLQQINKTWTKQARQLQLKEAVEVP